MRGANIFSFIENEINGEDGLFHGWICKKFPFFFLRTIDFKFCTAKGKLPAILIT